MRNKIKEEKVEIEGIKRYTIQNNGKLHRNHGPDSLTVLTYATKGNFKLILAA